MNTPDYIVTCLTYKRINPAILGMLKRDEHLHISFGVRREELASGFYNSWMHEDWYERVSFIPLDNVIDAGDTRQKILDAVLRMGFTYCVMLDDTVENLRDTRWPLSEPSEVIEDALEAMKMHWPNPIGLEFLRPGCTIEKTRKAYIQAWIIDVKRLHEANIQFKPVRDVGWDDFVFSWEVHNAGFYTIGLPWYVRIAKSTYPWANQPGGTHVGEDFDIQKMIDKNNARCKQAKEYLEKTFGAKNVSIRKLTSGGRTFDYVHAEWRNV